MLTTLLCLAAAAACASARYTVPVPIHYEIEAQFKKQSGNNNLRWDPTNYLTFLAAVYAQCSNIYDSDGMRLQQAGRVNNATAFNTLQKFFDPSLLQSNLIVVVWDIISDEAQDAGTVDRDIRKLGTRTGTGPLQNLASIDSGIRSFDRFGCSVDTKCKVGNNFMMALVCIFGQSVPVALRPTAGAGGNGQQPTQAPARPTVAPRTQRPTTARPRPTTTTTTATPGSELSGGLFDTYGTHCGEFYETAMMEDLSGITPSIDADIIVEEQKLRDIGLCQFQADPSGYTSALLQSNNLPAGAIPLMYATVLNPRPTESDLTANDPMTDVAKSSLRAVMQPESKVVAGEEGFAPTNIACAWALCSQKYVLACAAWSTDAKRLSS